MRLGVLVVAAVAAAGLMAGCGGGAAAGTQPSVSPDSAPPSSAAPLATLAGTCTLGYLGSDGTFLPLALANVDNPTAEQVILTNTGTTGVRLTSFSTSVSYQGRVLTTQPASEKAGNLPYFIAPGQLYSALVTFKGLPGTITISATTYLHSTCSVASWHGS